MDFTKFCLCMEDRELKGGDNGSLICLICGKIYHSELTKALNNIESY